MTRQEYGIALKVLDRIMAKNRNEQYNLKNKKVENLISDYDYKKYLDAEEHEMYYLMKIKEELKWLRDEHPDSEPIK